MWVDCWWLSWVMFTCIIWSSGGSVESMISGCKSKWSKQIELRAKQSRLSESNQRWGKKWRRNFFFCHTDQVTPSWRTIPNRWSCRVTKSVVIPSPLLQLHSNNRTILFQTSTSVQVTPSWSTSNNQPIRSQYRHCRLQCKQVPTEHAKQYCSNLVRPIRPHHCHRGAW